MSRPMPLYKAIAVALDAMRNCEKHNNTAWRDTWRHVLKQAENCLPQGSGFDSYPKVDLNRSGSNKITITGSYHNMDQNGSYCGWYDYTLVVRADMLNNFSLKLTGGNADFKDYAYEVFSCAMRDMFDADPVIAAYGES